MRIHTHILPSPSLGTQRQLQSLHFGAGTSGRKVYIQASLHADEIPGLLLAQHLRQALAAVEAAIPGEIVLVPVANPIGLAQMMQGQSFGRFDFPSGINFNRGFAYLTPDLISALDGKLGPDAAQNVALVRHSAKQLLAARAAHTETQALKQILQGLAQDADIVLDLHCDNEAVLHLYTGTALAAECQPLAQYLHAEAVLVAEASGDDPFDEACSRIWWELAAHFGPEHPLPLSCLAVTVELRSQVDVNDTFAARDCAGLLAFLSHTGHIETEAPPLPAALCQATPLAGVEPLLAPHAGIIVFQREVGTVLNPGDLVAEVVAADSGQRSPVHTSVKGKMYARTNLRYAQRGQEIARVAGDTAFRSGNLLAL